MMSVFSDAVLAGLVGQGRKVVCPFCDRRVMSQGDFPFAHSGIGQHLRAHHPEHADAVLTASKRLATQRKNEERIQRNEKQARPLRKHVVTGAFLDEIVSEIESLISMMEPYYSQCNGAREADALIERIGEMQRNHCDAVLLKGEIDEDRQSAYSDEEDDDASA